MSRLLIPCLSLLLVAACGDPLLDGNYRGEPLFTVTGTITVGENASAFASETTRVAVLWIGSQQQELFGQGLSQSSFPARYELTIYSEPANGARQKIPNSEFLYALARVVLYQDLNGNEQLDPGEPLTGGAEEQLIAFFPEAGTADGVGGGFRQGFATMQVLPCDERSGATVDTFMTPSVDTDVDLALTGEISTALSDLDCDLIIDDLCLQTLQALQENPNDESLLAFYDETCVDDDQALEPNNAEDGNNTPDNNTANNTANNANPNGDQTVCPSHETDNIDLGNELFTICQNERIQECEIWVDQLREASFIESWTPLANFSECIGAYDFCNAQLNESQSGIYSLSYADCVYEHFQIDQPEPPECPPFLEYVESLEQGARREGFFALFEVLCPNNG